MPFALVMHMRTCPIVCCAVLLACQSDPTANGFGLDSGSGPEFVGTVYFIPDSTTKFPDVSTLTPQGIIYTPSFDVPTSLTPIFGDRTLWFAIEYRGYVAVGSTGTYSFRMISDDGALLYIDGNKVIDDDGLHSALEGTGTATLTKGTHAVVVDYLQGPLYMALQLWVTPPGGAEELLRASEPPQ